MKSTRVITRRGGIKSAPKFGSFAVTLTQLNKAVLVAKKEIIQQVQKILQSEKRKGQVEIILAGDALLKRLNREFAGKNKTTDVLSFPFNENVSP